MAKRRKRPKIERQLPNAPLVEVIFELRWKLYGDSVPLPLRSDPGILPLLATFSAKMSELGYGVHQDMARVEETAGQSIIRRFRKGVDLTFPLMQVGSGIFASNDGPTYEWERYRDQILLGITTLLESYPNLPGFPLQPESLELRYIDMFDETLLQTNQVTEFVSNGTTMQLDPPRFMKDGELFEADMPTRVLFNATPKARKNTLFIVDLGASKRGESTAVRLESKVVTRAPAVPTLSNPETFVSDVREWLEFAHGLTSPFFKSFVTASLMDRFRTTTP